jgi:hypothetical protein
LLAPMYHVLLLLPDLPCHRDFLGGLLDGWRVATLWIERPVWLI